MINSLVLNNYNLVSGIFLLTFLSFLLFFAYRFYQTERHTLSLLLIFLFGFICRIFVSLFPNLHSWDERFHALAAKNISACYPFPFLYKNHFIVWNTNDWMLEKVWVHKPPMLSYIISASISVLGNTAFAVRFPTILISSFLVVVIYAIAFELFKNRFVAIVSAFLLAINGFIIELSGGLLPTDHYDVFLMCFSTIAIYFLIRNINKRKVWNYIYAGLFIALAFNTKLFTSLFIFYVLLFIDLVVSKLSVGNSIKNLGVTLAVFLAITLPSTYLTQLYSSGAFLGSFYELLNHATKVYDQGGAWYFYLDKIRINYGEGIYIYLIAALVYFFYNRKDTRFLLILSWIVIPILIFSLSETKMPGYILISSPAILILYGFIASWLRDNYKDRFFNWFIIITIFVLPLRYTLERVKPFTNYTKMYKDHRIYLEGLKKLDEKSIVVNDQRSIETMYFSNATSYNYYASSKEVDSLKKQGFSVYEVLIGDKFIIKQY